MTSRDYNLSALLTLESFNGDWNKYIESVYATFVNDFVNSKPLFRGTRLRLKSHPFVDGKEYTFYHFTHKGDIENERTPDLRRCERIHWAKPTIEKCDKWKIKIWPQKRHGKDRLCIWLELENEPDYIVILDMRRDYILPWTAFVLEYGHEKRKKQKEYEAYLKTRTAQSS
ncbi:MAG: hypothetical protein ACYC49_11085 [Ignavibacteriaceae bacterium]